MAKLIGNKPNQVPTNGDLGTMAYQDYDVIAPQLMGGRRNILINGDFQVWQRGTSFTTSNFLYTADRWQTYDPSSLHTISRQTENGVPFLRMDTGTDSSMPIWQKVEGQERFCGKTLTMSVVFKTTAGNSVKIYRSVSGVGDSHSTTVTATGSKQTVTLTMDIPDYATETPSDQNNFGVALLNDDYLDLYQVQLELGSVATPFEHRSYGEELALCQRYYQEFTSSDGSGRHFYIISDQNGAGHSHYLPFMAQMRVAPSVASYVFGSLKIMEANGGYQTTGLTMQGTSVNSPTGFAFYITGISADRRDSICTLYDSSFTFTFDAEM